MGGGGGLRYLLHFISRLLLSSCQFLLLQTCNTFIKSSCSPIQSFFPENWRQKLSFDFLRNSRHKCFHTIFPIQSKIEPKNFLELNSRFYLEVNFRFSLDLNFRFYLEVSAPYIFLTVRWQASTYSSKNVVMIITTYI